MKSFAIVSMMTAVASTTHADTCFTQAVVVNRTGMGSVHGTVDTISGQEVQLSDGTELAYASNLPMPFAVGDHIGVTFRCDFKATGSCEVRIENAKHEVLVIAVRSGADGFSDGWRTKPGDVHRWSTDPPELERRDLVMSKGSTSASIDSESCTRVTEGGVDWLMAGAAISQAHSKPQKIYSIQRAP